MQCAATRVVMKQVGRIGWSVGSAAILLLLCWNEVTNAATGALITWLTFLRARTTGDAV